MTRAALVFILCAFVALCVLYNLKFPLLESIDEPSQYWHVNQIANTKGLPDLDEYKGDPLTYERHQMPLYYILSAILVSPIDRSDFSDYVQFNVGAASPNMLTHNQDEYAWPPRTTVLAVRVVRLFSTVLGLLTLIFIYRAILAFGFSPAVALVGIATLAFDPRYVLLSSSVTNDIACACSTAGAIALLTHSVAAHQRGNKLTAGRAFALGFVSGIALLTKLNSIVILAPMGVGLLFCAYDQKRLNLRALLRWCLTFAVGFALALGPYLVYSTFKYGDPMAVTQRGAILSPYERPEPLTISNLPYIAIRLVRTWWDYYGAGGLVTPYQYVGFALAGLACLGFIIALIRKRLPSLNAGTLIPLSLFVAMSIAFVPWLLLYQGSIYARFFAPAFVAIQIFIGIGLTTLLGRLRSQKALLIGSWAALAAGAAGAALVVPLFITPAYSTVTYLSPAKARALPEAGRVSYDNGIQLVAATPSKVRLDPGETLDLHVLWRLEAERATLQYLVIQVNDQDDKQLARQVLLPFDGHYNTNQWGAGVLSDTYHITMPQVSQTSLVKIMLGWYAYDAPHRVARVTSSDAESAVVATVKLRGARQPDATPTKAVQVSFGQAIALEGYDLQDGQLTLYWRSVQPVDQSYSVFVHLLDAGDQIVGQADGPISYGTQFWDAGEQVLDQRTLPDMNKVTSIQVGLYDPQTTQRLAAQSEGLPVSDNAVTLWQAGQP
jgi:MFS family permease